jgi:transposase
MEKVYPYVGIDVSKDKRDVAIAQSKGKYLYSQVANSAQGFSLLLNPLPTDACWKLGALIIVNWPFCWPIKASPWW